MNLFTWSFFSFLFLQSFLKISVQGLQAIILKRKRQKKAFACISSPSEIYSLFMQTFFIDASRNKIYAALLFPTLFHF